MKNYETEIREFISIITSPPVLIVIAFILVMVSTKACYEFGKDVGASIYFLNHK